MEWVNQKFQKKLTYSKSTPGLLWLNLPICLPDCFTFSLDKRLKHAEYYEYYVIDILSDHQKEKL